MAKRLKKPPARPGAAKKRTASRPAKTAGKQKPLPTMEDEFKVPRSVQKAADAYNDALLKKGRAIAAFNTAKDKVLDAMKEHGIKKVRVMKEGGGFRLFEHDTTDKITAKVVKEKQDEDE